ncbi:MAG: delta-60 repeat domain-containing protein, partial [Xanthomonadales bacterium]|nr:delta-60 repeat domain-containing protein [Xanthomonadales bacterium]
MPLRFVASLLFILAACSAPVRAQLLLAAPNLDLRTEGTVRAMARLADGALIVGGQFQSVNGLPRTNIARLLPDGSVDTGWAPQLDGAVLALAIA